MVDGMVVKMGGDDVRRHIVGRMLHRRERIDILPHGQHYDTAGMLPGASSDTGTSLDDPINLAVPLMDLVFVVVIFHITESSLVRHRRDRPRTVSLSMAEDYLRVFMRLTLVLPGEIQIDIRLLIPHKAEESLKRNVKAIFRQHLSALRAFPIRHITAGASHKGLHLLGVKIIIEAVGTPVVRAQGIYLCDAGQERHEGRSHRTPGTYQISVLHRFPH